MLLRSANTPEIAPAAIVVADEGMGTTTEKVAALVSSGKRVLALEPLFFGHNIPGTGDLGVSSYSQMLNGLGERTLGLEAAQVIAVVEWLHLGLQNGSPTPGSAFVRKTTPAQIDVVASGPRSQSVTLTAAALEPLLFASLEIQHSIPSFGYVLEHPLKYSDVPELMCLDLFRNFDFDALAALAAPAQVHFSRQ